MIGGKLDKVEEIKNYSFQEEFTSRAVVSLEPEENRSLKYGLLNVTEDATGKGELAYTIEAEEYPDLEISFLLQDVPQKRIRFLEAVSQGHSFDVWSKFYSGDYNDSPLEENIIDGGFGDDQLPEEYRESLNDFLHDVIWEE
ncbi:MAG: hypothetical protein ACI9LV_000252 [Candidatus Nanohaloarchaea archaeon]|jgi:hypothetical protein